MKVLATVLACIASMILYRAGGMSKEPSASPLWMPMWMRQSWVRDWLCPLVLFGLVVFVFGLHAYWWCYLIFYGLSGAALSTYWDWLYGYDNYFVHGFFCGLATVPLYWVGVAWWIIAVHILVVSLGMGLWSDQVENDKLEEYGRGVFFIL